MNGKNAIRPVVKMLTGTVVGLVAVTCFGSVGTTNAASGDQRGDVTGATKEWKTLSSKTDVVLATKEWKMPSSRSGAVLATKEWKLPTAVKAAPTAKKL